MWVGLKFNYGSIMESFSVLIGGRKRRKFRKDDSNGNYYVHGNSMTKFLVFYTIEKIMNFGTQVSVYHFSSARFKIHFWVSLGNQLIGYGFQPFENFRSQKSVTPLFPICLQSFVQLWHFFWLVRWPLTTLQKNVFLHKLLAHSNWNFWSFQTQPKLMITPT